MTRNFTKANSENIVMNFNCWASMCFSTTYYHWILKSRLHVSLDQFKVSCEVIPVSALQIQDRLYQARVLWSAHEGVLWSGLGQLLCHWGLEWRIVTLYISVCGVVFFRCMEKIVWIQGTTHGCQSLSSGLSQTERTPALLGPVSYCLFTPPLSWENLPT